ncbi:MULTISPECIES: 2-amino-4-hydroxy-6-hydroxymethyldihydropteridine diphosphokinase [unclassified Rothia (in: high G+C Gram-positive bacteria)]|uniref:2-amino-4-hydroxy-6- hydroxymethyldihydropteridine diphosphokinase n=1 Tax=unclassified Rothia (in: high G+C Gram-positive bacteria) TaxID=2689056 RepID=UPI00195D58B9|nr:MULTISPECIES: 2-amino-4-hydroxy-6-hydroxymethyldihydropteridine diphosphokinase [unclassified Rothia (in: high G+C Gram-positive bacteria)]MBM7051612.1 2-amino-4-hydroxy-6-hydroxymethyldihydropteridine diphosphokinase [Rothia sp. ZJ1223]QRZ61753.1 2-amino-4-hydroxy-6-hydroxymethyldihydropteridine diphosphokinase [Rothia sp. ZJ932]
MSVEAVLGLGSNLGEKQETLLRAIVDICSHPKIRVKKVSPVAVTAPVGGPAHQPDFVNLVVRIETDLSPFDLLDFTQSVENKHHRVRDVRWGPRTLDIDIIDYSTLEMDEPDLTLPHPRAAERAFVLEPWARMEPEAVLSGASVRDLAKTADDADGIREFFPAPVVCE